MVLAMPGTEAVPKSFECHLQGLSGYVLALNFTGICLAVPPVGRSARLQSLQPSTLRLLVMTQCSLLNKEQVAARWLPTQEAFPKDSMSGLPVRRQMPVAAQVS